MTATKPMPAGGKAILPPEQRRTHEWQLAGIWGVIIGVSRCKRCGQLATAENLDQCRDQRPTEAEVRS